MALQRRNRDADDKKAGTFRATSIEIFKREIVADVNTSEKIYSRDADNLYPSRIEGVINNSPTGRRVANLMAKYIIGNGNTENYEVGKKAGKTVYINDILRESGIDIAYQYGVYFRLKYNLDAELSSDSMSYQFKPGMIEVLDYVVMAKSKEDDTNFPGKLYALKSEEDGGFSNNMDDAKWFYPYNSNPKVILRQMQNDCKLKKIDNPTAQDLIRNYRGQVYYMNLTPKYVYALSLADAVYNDLDTEFRISTYNNTQTRSGFLGKTIFVKYAEEEEAAEDFEDEAEKFLGSENSGTVLIVEVPQDTSIDDLEKAFVAKQLKAQFDDKLFESTIKNLRQNILGAFNNAPEPLVFAGTGSLFGTSADTYTEMKKFYWEQNEYERSQLEQTLRMFGYDVNILPIVQETKTTEDV